MHYTDGTEARVGDTVKGTGHNLPYEIVGPVVQLTNISQDTCNIMVETRTVKRVAFFSDGDGGTDIPEHLEYETFIEHGDAKRFTLLHRIGWTHAPLTLPGGRIYKRIWIKDSDLQ